MLVVYECKQCGQVTITGYINEYDEHFCSKTCYKNYCRDHNYMTNLEKLKEIKLL